MCNIFKGNMFFFLSGCIPLSQWLNTALDSRQVLYPHCSFPATGAYCSSCSELSQQQQSQLTPKPGKFLHPLIRTYLPLVVAYQGTNKYVGYVATITVRTLHSFTWDYLLLIMSGHLKENAISHFILIWLLTIIHLSFHSSPHNAPFQCLCSFLSLTNSLNASRVSFCPQMSS